MLSQHAPRRQLQPQLLVALMAMAVAVAPGAGAARILGIFPTPSISHQLPFQAVMKALAAQGHHVTVISTDPLKVPVANYTDIDLSFSYKDMRDVVVLASMSNLNPIEMLETVAPGMMQLIDAQLSSQQVQDFLRYNASEGYDMVLLEWLFYQAYFGVVHAVGSPPLVGIVSLGAEGTLLSAIGNPHNPAYNPGTFTEFSDHMTFWQRLYNTYMHLRMMWFKEMTLLPENEKLLRKHFGSAPPPARETEYNMSLLLLNNHWSTEYPRALLPNVVQLTGLHVREAPRALPADLQAWMDPGAAPHGVVYFSLGSNVLSKDLPRDKLGAIVRALSRLPQRVLWKWEEDELPGRPANVRTAKWLPQQDVLAHPNVRLFVTQGGLQSFQEAAYHGVPLLGIPFIGDQHYNVAKMLAAGVGERLLFKDLTEDALHAKMSRVLADPAYAQRMKRFSAVYREHKARSLDEALWWVEYVLRHQGAPHLRPASLDLQWYQLLLLDVAAAVAVAALAAALVAACVARAVWRAVKPSPKTSVNVPNNFRRHRKDE